MRSYQDAVQVQVQVQRAELSEEPAEEAAPSMFVWRGRLYVVRAVLSHWRERAPWWQTALESKEPGALATLAATEQIVWRVEASAGRARGTGTYDLACLPAAARGPDGAPAWTLVRVVD